MKQRKPEGLFLIGLLFLLIFSLSARAQDIQVGDEGSDKTEMVFSYTRDKTPKEDVAANISVITQEDIKKIPASTAAEVLQYVPGVYVEFNGGLGSLAAPSIQGTDTFNDNRQVAVYQDGVPLNGLSNPLTDLSYLPVENIERIEVYKGAASAVWGSGLGGVINIITKEPDLTKPVSGNIQSSVGQHGTTRNGGTVSGGIDRVGYLVSLSHDQTDGFVPLTRYWQDSAYTKLNYMIGESSRLGFTYSYDEGRNQSPSALIAGAGFWDEAYQRRAYERLLFDTSLSESLGWTIEGRHMDTFSNDHYHPPTTRSGWGWDYSDGQWGISSRLRYDIKDFNHLVLGFDGDWGSYDFSSFTRTFDTGNWAVYANDTFDIRAFSFIAGIRYDNNLDFGSQVSPVGGAVYHFQTMESLVRFQVARGFTAPPGAWLHAPVYGNSKLKAETGINYQLGGEIKPLKFLKLELDLFESDIDNFIKPDYTLQPIQMENIGKVTRRGVEGRIGTSFDYGPASRLALSFGGSFADVRDDATGKVIQDIPRNLYDITASYTYKNVTNSIIGRYVFNNSSVSETHDEVFVFDYLVKVKLPSKWVGHAFVPSLFLAVHNLTDADYLYRTVFPQPGRWFEGGARIDF